MIALTVFIVYNSVIAFALLPPSHLKPTRVRPVNKVQLSSGTSSLSDVFMHIIVNPNNEIDLNTYLPSIEQISNKYVDFKYNLVLLRNDTSSASTSLSAEENNEIAFNSLWHSEHNRQKEKKSSNIHVQYVVLSQYMDKSPLRKYWRHLPDHFIPFLVRAVSIWDKGGIAINPDILTLKLPNVIYLEKLHNILQNYGKPRESKSNTDIIKNLFDKSIDKNKKKVNNIQDIIEELEHEDDSSLNSSKDGLMEAENRDSLVKSSGRNLLSTSKDDFASKIELSNFTMAHINKRYIKNENNTEFQENKQLPNNGLKTRGTLASPFVDIFDFKETLKNKTKLSLLPLFLEFLFHDKTKLNLPQIKPNELAVTNATTRQRKSVLPFEILKRNSSAVSANYSNKNDSTINNKYQPMIIAAKSIEFEANTINKTNDISTKYEKGQLTIDLKGNIIATETPCHAFIGTIFSNVVHHTADETLKDFIIAELSYFCKGLLSSCRGLDVILL